ncbi:proteasome adapter and scaffold protein ECM29 [Abrus precatorius]|uniref:Proteasome adapter and scaffold protein ECM29 n=1 Tax=Abrus precatorius TaxID=3816 RepID=A0A8B8JD88_ABRPR|nr:proteasome adapter and scaffold protein ECM29 [Abrus precatorius]
MAEPSSSTPAAKSDAEIEEMLDRMLTRLALCDDSKLEPLLSKLLPLCISSLSSQSLLVRNKVLEILSHVNKRVKLQPDIGLPLLDLWKLYSESGAVPIIRNFCIVYIEMAFQRVNAKEKEDLAPDLLVNISKLPLQHQEIILRIIVKVIGECHSGQIGDEVAAKYKKVDSYQDRELFIEFCLHTMLYQRVTQSGGYPPGLSVAQLNRVTGKQHLQSNELLLRKLGILNLIQAMELASELVYPLYIAASVDCEEPVVKRGEELLKKKASGANLDDLNLINRLFLLFNGTVGGEHVDSETRVSPGSPALKGKLMSVFCRSIAAANNFPSTLQCIFGCIYGNGTTSRLKQLGMEFTVWVFKHAKIDQLKLMGPVILSGIMKSLDNYQSSEADASAREVKTYAFQAIGLLAQRMPQLFREKIDMAARLFHALKTESQSLRFVVQEATISLAPAYKVAPLAVLQDLETLLLKNSQVEESEVRFCAVRWATSLFDLQHCPSRFICMLGVADVKLDIREMALEGLCLLKSESQIVGLKYPKLGVMLDYIIQQQPKVLESTETREQNLLFPSNTYVAMIKFLLKCFESELEQKKSLEVSSELMLSVKTFCLVLEHSMSFEGSVELHVNASKALLIIGSHMPEVVASHYALKVSWLKQLLSHVDWDTRESIARIFGIVSSALPIPDVMSELTSLFSQTHKSRFETRHGALCAIGYVTANYLSRTPMPEILLQNTLRCLVDVVSSETLALAAAAMQALGHIGLRIPLPPLNESNSAGILIILSDKLSKLLLGDDIKAIQKIAISIGHICVKETSSTQLDVALNLVFSLCRSKVEDILFAAGEALSFLWGGVPVTADIILKTNYTSLSMASNFLMGDLKQCTNEQTEYSEDYHASVRNAITKKLFDVLLYSSRKEERCAGTVWLVSLIKYCGNHPTIQQMLPEIQEAFSHLLGEQNELTQELASQGMSIVYDLGDESMKKNLVSALVNTLTGSGKRKRAIKLVEDTEVFQDGALGESASGGKLNTYKELCNLANEMGQPDLIYKFMDLANYQASLNSKRGAAFGFSKIAKQAGDALKPYLRSLIPRLVRYQYDPDKNVQDAMVHIWKSLVADSKKTIDENLDLIIDDLLVQCGSRLWRSRESSCLALADIIQGRKFYEVEKHLKRLWSGAFRAMDDIKETVRISGEKLCRAVTSLTTRLCDVSLTDMSDAHKAMDIVLPFLLAEGIVSKVNSVRKASIGVVMKLTKHAGTAIRPHMSDLVCCMLESLSSLEDQGLNYVELHAANVGIQREKLESLRISIAKGSPMWETLDSCIKVVDAESLNALIPRLAHLVRSGVGLNTRVGIANFITLLLESVGVDIKPYANMLVRLLFPVVKDEKSTAAKRAFASACAKVLNYIAVSQAQKLIEDTAALHAGDKNSQIACAFLLKSYSSMAADVVGGYHAVIIPIVFLSRFEDDKNVSSLFEELWEEYTSGERITLHLYLGEIVSLICEGMSSSSWASKRKSAQAICRLSEVLGESLSSHHEVLLQSLMKEIPGRLWEGKDVLLLALGSLSTSCHKAILAEGSSSSIAILNLVSSACTRKGKKYREAALSSLEQVIKAFGNPEFFNMVFPLLFDLCNSEPIKSGQAPLVSDAAESELDSVEEISVPQNKIADCLTSCIHVAHINDILEKQKSLLHMYAAFLVPEHKWTVKTTAFLSIKELCSRLHTVPGNHELGGVTSFVQEMFHSISPKILHCISTIKIAQVHVSASECLLEVLKLSIDVSLVTAIDEGFKEELLHQYEIEKNEEAKSLLRKCVRILQDWKK